MIDKMKYIELEVAIASAGDGLDVYEEDFLVNAFEKIRKTFENLIAYLKEFVKRGNADISALFTKQKVKMQLAALKKRAAAGETITLPNFNKIRKVYQKYCAGLPKELAKVKWQYSHAKKAFTWNWATSNMEKLKRDIEDAEAELKEACAVRRKYKGQEGVIAIDSLMRENKIMLDSYVRMITELERFWATFERTITVAKNESKFVDQVALNQYSNCVTKTYRGCTSLLKNALFVTFATFG